MSPIVLHSGSSFMSLDSAEARIFTFGAQVGHLRYTILHTFVQQLWQDFKWHSTLFGPSAVAEPLISFLALFQSHNSCPQSKLEGGGSDCTQLMTLLPNGWSHTARKCTRQQQQQLVQFLTDYRCLGSTHFNLPPTRDCISTSSYLTELLNSYVSPIHSSCLQCFDTVNGRQ